MSRRVMLTVSNFLQALAIVAESDLVAAMPRHFVMRYAARYRVVVTEPPIPLQSSPVLAIAPQVATMDGGLSWLLGALERSARTSLK
jgi:DNA-binding transcriptional LysR family regulator